MPIESAASAAVLAALIAISSNLLVNGDFEQLDGANLPGWPGLTTANISTEIVHSGQRAVAIERENVAGDGSSWAQGFINTVPGQRYKLVGWVRCDEFSGDGWGYPELAVLDSSWQRTGIAPEAILSRCGDGRWHDFALSFKAAEGGTLMRFGMIGPRSNVRLYFDTLRLFAAGPNEPPTIDPLIGPLTGSAPLTVSFDARAADSDGAINHVRWDFGDGRLVDQPDGQIVMVHRGQWPVSLLVLDDDGAEARAEFTISVEEPLAPFLTLNMPSSTNGLATSEDSFDLSGSISPGAHGDAPDWLVIDHLDSGWLLRAPAEPDWQVNGIPLLPGRNQLLLTLTDEAGRASTSHITIERLVSGPEVRELDPDPPVTGRYQTWAARFQLDTVARHPLYAYDPNPPPGAPVGSGVSALLRISLPDGSELVQPAFHRHQVISVDGHLEETGLQGWELRYTPRQTGTHSLVLEIEDASGNTSLPLPDLEVTPSDRPGFIRVSEQDWRYFQRDNGDDFFPRGPALDPRWHDNQGALNLRRPWLGGFGAFSSNWSRWISAAESHGNEGFMAPLDFRDRLPGAELSMFLFCQASCGAVEGDGDGWRLWQGFLIEGTEGRIRAGHRYRVLLRLRSEGLTPAAQGAHGLVMKTHDWPPPGQSWRDYLDGLPATRTMLGPLAADRPWHTLVSYFVAEHDASNISLYLSNTERGQVAIDTISVREVDAHDQVLGGELMRSPRADLHRQVDPRGAAAFEALVNAAEASDVALKVVIQDKNDWIPRHLSRAGLFAAIGDGYYQDSDSYWGWIQQQWWRYLAARWAPSTAIFSFELNNEGSPDAPDHYQAAQRMASYFRHDIAHPHLATTSFWCCWRPEFWSDLEQFPDIGYADLHEYTDNADPPLGAQQDALETDLAGLHLHLAAKVAAAQIGRPTLRAESGLAPGSPNFALLANTANPGHWFHNLLWAQLDGSAVFDTGYWWSEHFAAVDQYQLGSDQGGRSRVGIATGFARFLSTLNLADGGYQSLSWQLEGEPLRVIGQHNPARGTAHAWIQHPKAGWRTRLLDADTLKPRTALVELDLGSHGPVLVEWWDTRSGTITRVEQQQADGQGRLHLLVEDLAHDIALRVVPADQTWLFRDRFESSGPESP